MDSIQTKRILKKIKKILSLVNHIFSLDETIIKFSGNRNDSIFKLIQLAFEDALSSHKFKSKYFRNGRLVRS